MPEHVVAEAWEYADADTQYHMHGIHPWPARMIPQIAHRLIDTRSSLGATVLDPFCGSGGVLTEAMLLGRNGVGCDINPLAVMIAKVKTTLIEPSELESAYKTILSYLAKRKVSGKLDNTGLMPPAFNNIHHWFTQKAIINLTVLRDCIERAVGKDERIMNFFFVCLSNTIRKSSNIRADDNPYFIRAMVGEELIDHNPDVETIFTKQTERAIERMKQFYTLCPKNVSAKIHLEDCRKASIEEGTVDLVVTSPPYGEESHTMSYSRFTKLGLLWMRKNITEINLAAERSMGGEKRVFRKTIPELDSIYENVAQVNNSISE